MYISFRVETPCDFINIDTAGSILYNSLQNYFKDITSVEFSGPNGRFATAGEIDVFQLDIEVDIDFEGNLEGSEEEFISKNYEAFTKFTKMIAEELEDAVNSLDVFSELPDADVYIDEDTERLFISAGYDPKSSLSGIKWSKPTVSFIDEIDDALSDLYYILS